MSDGAAKHSTAWLSMQSATGSIGEHLKKSSRSRRATTSMSTVTSSNSSTCTPKTTLTNRKCWSKNCILHDLAGTVRCVRQEVSHSACPLPAVLCTEACRQKCRASKSRPNNMRVGDDYCSKSRHTLVIWHAVNRRLCQCRVEMLEA